MREKRSRIGAGTGARLSEQLPVTTDVMPCSIAGIRVRVEAELRVVVRVRIDEAGRHDLAASRR